MIRGIALLVASVILALSTPAFAAELESGVVEGQVSNGTEGSSSSVADHDVVLKTYLDGTETGSATAKTDAEGGFRFEGLSTSPTYVYQVSLQYQEAEYTSEWLSFGDGETTKSVEVTVYDSTTSDEAIKITVSHTIVYVEEGSLLVKDYLLFVNEGDRTYVGSREVTADGKKETLRFPLPKEATELQYTLGLMECCAVSSEDGFVDTMAIVPGASGLEPLKWTAMALIGLVVLGFGYPLIRKRLRPASAETIASEESLGQRRQRLLSEIAQLDDEFEGGKISQEAYQRTRSERKAQLVELIRMFKEKSGGS